MQSLIAKIADEETSKISDLNISHLENLGLKNIQLRDYQLVGVNWLLSRISRGHGAILCDEMGLGKTCQSISFLLGSKSKKVDGPFLIVAPLSVINNWKDELTRFAPILKLIVYIGDKDGRAEMRSSLQHDNFSVLLTTYEIFMKDEEYLSKVQWDILIVDEGHRLKNKNSLLHQMLSEASIKYRFLLTGTPVQNNLNELYTLLHFVAPKIFSWKYCEDFVERYSDSEAKGLSDELFKLLRSFLLRRTKVEVLKDLPNKTEIVLFHGITNIQKKYYKAILTKDREAFDGESGPKTRLMNILMQLRKCVNHPYLFHGVEPEPFEAGEHLVEASGKLILIDHLLAYLRPLGHKVLLFSQMTRMLDILQDYLTYRDYSYERLDGSVRGEERFLAVKNFNEMEDTFVFLLSTKAGGQGLNLASADTVIFVDSDYNPQNDIQAAARAHRIGQRRPVKVIRLIGRHTVEEIILRRAESKVKLTNQVIEGGQFALGVDKEELIADSNMKLQDILKFGVHNLFESDEEEVTKPPDFVAILGPSKDGEWVEQEVSAVEEMEEEDVEETVAHMYLFEGKDYSKEPSAEDRKTFEAVLEAEKQLARQTLESGEYTLRKKGDSGANNLPSVSLPEISKKPRRKLTPEELAERKKKREATLTKKRLEEEERELKYAQRQKEKLLSKWKAMKYESCSVEIEEDEEGSSEEAEEFGGSDDEDDAGDAESKSRRRRKEIRFVSGDVTQPQFVGKEDVIICHSLDDSGRWGSGGVFTALSNRSPQPENCYTVAGKAGDLALGDLHLVACDDVQSRSTGRDYAGLMVTQTRDRRGNLSAVKMAALDECLRKLYFIGTKKRASVHLPRIGHNTPNFNWYGVERLIRKRLSSRGIPVFIYYYPRRRKQHLKRPQSDDEKSEDSGKPQARRRKQLKDISDSDDSEHEQSAAVNTSESMNLSSRHLQDAMSDKKVHFYHLSDGNKLQRMVVALDGEVSDDLDDHVTHIVARSDDLPHTIPKGCILVSEKWVTDSFKKKKCQGEAGYRL